MAREYREILAALTSCLQITAGMACKGLSLGIKKPAVSRKAVI